MSQRDVKQRIDSVKNIRKITSAMQMVAAARLRRAEQRIAALRPYADAVRRMTRQAAAAAGGEATGNPILAGAREREDRRDPARDGRPRPRRRVQLADHPRRPARRRGAREAGQGRRVLRLGRRGVSSLLFRNFEPAGQYTGFTDRPALRERARDRRGPHRRLRRRQVDRVELFYNGYVSPLVQEVRREVLLPLQRATIDEAAEAEDEDDRRGGGQRALVEYEPDPDAILQRLVPDYVEISVFRALLESTASEHGARMTAMRSASDNAGEVIEDLTLEMNRARQAEITQEIMEVVAGAESLT